jgi:hypothetical protein
MDQYSKLGLKRAAGRKGTFASYKEYLQVFDQEYADSETQVTTALKHPWVLETADRFGCPRDPLASRALRRKLFDDYPMYAGGYKT